MRKLSGGLAAALCLLAPGPSIADPLDVAVGKAVFDRLWAQAPGSTASADGLGPLHAARGCASCHRGGGRTGFRLGRDDPAGHPGLVVRLGDADGRPDPVYGRQLQPEGLGGVPGEGRAQVEPGARSEAPRWSVAGWAYGAPAPDTRISPRVAPALDGIGLLARVPEAEILSRADEGDRDRDGVSGRPARLASGEIGRFGWKASEPTLEAQVASAFLLDLGLSSVARPEPAGDCTEAQAACRAAPHGAAPGEPEVAPKLMAALLAFLHRRPPAAGRAIDRGRKTVRGGRLRRVPCAEPQARGRRRGPRLYRPAAARHGAAARGRRARGRRGRRGVAHRAALGAGAGARAGRRPDA